MAPNRVVPFELDDRLGVSFVSNGGAPDDVVGTRDPRIDEWPLVKDPSLFILHGGFNVCFSPMSRVDVHIVTSDGATDGTRVWEASIRTWVCVGELPAPGYFPETLGTW